MLELKNVCFSAENDEGTKDIIKDISLTIDKGFVAIGIGGVKPAADAVTFAEDKANA